jgi:WD40 repeat protein
MAYRGTSGSLSPPAEVAGHRLRIQEENQKKIMRRRAEERLMREISMSGSGGLERLGDIREEIDREDRDRAARAEELLMSRSGLQARRPIIPGAYVDPEPFRAVRSIDLAARTAAVTHCGATIWAGDSDGTLRVCDGATGEVVHTIPGDRLPPSGEAPAPPVGAVTAMHATPTHLWVGYANGTVRVFDHTAFVHITEGTFHSGAVASFADAQPITGASSRTVSVGDDGCLVVWDIEERNFDAICKIVLPDAQPPASDAEASGAKSGGISCVTVVGGTHAYCGTLSGNLVVVNIATAEVEHVIAAHTDAVLGVCSFTGAGGQTDNTPYIASCSADCSFAVWKYSPTASSGNTDNKTAANTAEGGDVFDGHVLVARNPTPSPTLCIVPDQLNRRLWTGEQDGTVRIWLASLDDGFTLERALPPLGAPVVRLHTGPATDALKVWSLGSNGINKMWYSSTQRSELELARTIQTLKAIATQDGVELDKWRETVAKLQHVNTRRKLQLARLLLTAREDGLRRRYMWQWRLALLRTHARRRRHTVANRLEAEGRAVLGRRYFARWVDWTLQLQKRRIKVAYSRLLMANANRTAVQLYFSKMQTFARVVKNAKKRRDLVAVFGMQSQRSQMRNMFRKWLKFLRNQKLANRKIAYASAMMRTSDVSLTRVYYKKWQGAVTRRSLLNQRVEVAHLLLQQAATTRRRAAYLRWRRWVLRRKTLSRKAATVRSIVSVSEFGTRLVFFRKWLAFLRQCEFQRNEQRRLEAEEQLAAVRAHYKDLEGLIEEKRRLDEQDAEIDRQQMILEQQEMEIRRLELLEGDLRRELLDDADKARRQQQSLAEQFATLIAQLKAQVINFHQDAALIVQLRDKAKSVPVTKLFLEAHQQVKRVVVELTHVPHLMGTTEPWPLTVEKLQQVPGHSWTTLLAAIKTMIITFDLMDRQTRDQLNSDQEIVTNASWLQKMAEMSNEHRRKVLGRGAARVK